jgi:LmbE family N-acetylglucosaminyl deacetylase
MNDHHAGRRPTTRRISRLVVAPHAGDETFGCGGTLAKHCDDSAVAVLARPDEDRSVRFRKARLMLGGPDSFMFDLPHRDVGGDMDRIVGMLADLLALIRPTELYLPFPSQHVDHLAAYEAGLRSLRMPSANGSWTSPSVLLYDLGDGAGRYSAEVRWNVCESLREADIDRKVAAAMVYRSPLAHGLKSSAQDAGSAAHVPWAEKFALVRGPCVPRGFEGHPPESQRRAPAMVGGLR